MEVVLPGGVSFFAAHVCQLCGCESPGGAALCSAMRWLLVYLAAVLPMHAHDEAKDIAAAAQAFAEALNPAQRERAVFDFDSPERQNWHFVPKSRKGVSFGEMTADQRERAEALLRASLSEAGYSKVDSVLMLEAVLRELEGDWRDPGRYYFAVFGTPGDPAGWGWRAEGHHLSINVTVVRGTVLVSTPSFLGANPAEVREGPHRGLRALGPEEDLARQLVNSLTPEQQRKAIILERAPAEILNIPGRNSTQAEGIAQTELTPEQSTLLEKLISEYLLRTRPEAAKRQWEKIRGAGPAALHFAWAGSREKGQPHYYRVQGGSFVLEYDNTQNRANHVHSVWRDFDEEFGKDLLGEHYRSAHSQGGAH